MLNPQQLQYFKTFGFIVLENALSAEEVQTMREEWMRRVEESERLVSLERDTTRDMQALGPTTPFIAALFEDDRLAGVGEQIFDRLICAGATAHRYVGDTEWHYDAGGYEAYGLKFAIYLDPVRADSGALRLIPGSHLRPYHDQAARFDPVGPRWSRAAATPAEKKRALAGIGDIPCYVCDSDPGDIVAFDLRTYHASLGGSAGRRMCSFTYYNYPHTPAEIELTIHNAKGHLRSRDNSGDPWNPPTYPEQWLANSQNNARRAEWIDSLKRFSKMELGERGVNAVAENGKMVVVQA
jgi:hypothetical protein